MEFSPVPPPPSRMELEAFVGPKTDYYNRKFGKFTLTGSTKFEFGWNWPAFFGGVWWYLYRKMYWWGILDLAIWSLFGWTIFVPLLWMAARSITGDFLYFLFASKKIRDARGALSPGAPTDDMSHLARLQMVGGVQTWVLWVLAVFILVALLMLGLFSTAWVHRVDFLYKKVPGLWA